MRNLKLVQKMTGNRCIIFIVNSMGESYPICTIEYPHDHQLRDNIEASDAIEAVLRKRIRKSL